MQREEGGKGFTSRMSGGIRCSIRRGCSCGADRTGLVGWPPLRSQPPSIGLPQPSLATEASPPPQHPGAGMFLLWFPRVHRWERSRLRQTSRD